jgi:hypothetical protein
VHLEYGAVPNLCCTHVHTGVKVRVGWFRRTPPLCEVSYSRRVVPQDLTASYICRKYPVAPEQVLCALGRPHNLSRYSLIYYELRNKRIISGAHIAL